MCFSDLFARGFPVGSARQSRKRRKRKVPDSWHPGMVPISPLILAAFTGFLSGFLLSIPVGPINLTILNEGARRGFKVAALIGIGAVVMEVVYCAIAFTGF